MLTFCKAISQYDKQDINTGQKYTGQIYHRRLPQFAFLYHIYFPRTVSLFLPSASNHPFSISRMFYTWNLTVFKLWGVALFTQQKYLEIHLASCICYSLFLFITKYFSMVWIHQVCIIIHSLKNFWAVSNLGAITNKSAMNIPVYNLCKHKFSFLWDKCLRVKLLNYMIVTCLHI